jgi:Ala-tRNA(Pro) deacylase
MSVTQNQQQTEKSKDRGSTPPNPPVPETYDRLIALLDAHSASYSVIEHPPEGQTELASVLRGHRVDEAAKCLVLRVNSANKATRYVLAVIPGDRRVDFEAVKSLHGARYVAFAKAEVAEELALSPLGAVLPFSFDPRLELVVDPGVLARPTIYFNAGRLDRSLALASADYQRIARPNLATISTPAVCDEHGERVG